jgi:hypothetical protein
MIALGGCAKPFTPYYLDVKPQYKTVYDFEGPIVIAVQDQRPYVLTGDKTEFFYGISRSLYGIPYTANGGISAAQDIADLVSLLLSNENGTNVGKRVIDISLDGLATAKKMTDSERVLLLLVYEWKTDVPAIGTGKILYDIHTSIINPDGEIIMEKRITGKDEMISSEGKKSARDGRFFQKARADVIGKILLDPELIQSINGHEIVNHTSPNSISSEIQTQPSGLDDGSVVNSKPKKKLTQHKSSCTTKQILTMNASGMSDAQIQAACH